MTRSLAQPLTSKATAPATPFKLEPLEVRQLSAELGRRIRLARIRRNKNQDELARACGITRRTLYRLEQGDSGVSMGTMLSVLWALGLLDSTQAVADPDADQHGKILEAAKRPARARAEKPDNDF
jgi:transcriptional regulator with XRE-family HTH domain